MTTIKYSGTFTDLEYSRDRKAHFQRPQSGSGLLSDQRHVPLKWAFCIYDLSLTRRQSAEQKGGDEETIPGQHKKERLTAFSISHSPEKADGS